MNRPSKLSVVVADDQAEILDILVAWLRRAGHDVVGVGSGREAAAVLSSLWADVVVTDVLMPEGDGIELLAALSRRLPRPRLIAISGGGRYLKSQDCLDIARSYGADVALKKPFTLEQLIEAVHGGNSPEGSLPCDPVPPVVAPQAG